MTPTTTITTATTTRTSRFLGALVAAALLLAACGSSDEADRLAYAEEPETSTETVGPTDSDAVPTRDAATDLAAALDELGNGYRFQADMRTAGGGQISIDGYRIGEALSFELTVADLTIETVARDGTLWTRVAGDDEWSTDPWSTASDPIAPLREPVRVTAGEAQGDLVAVYQAAALGLGIDDTIDVTVTTTGGEVRFASTSDRVAMVSVLRADDSLPAIVAPA